MDLTKVVKRAAHSWMKKVAVWMTNHNFPDEEVGDASRQDEEAGDPSENRNLENCCLNCCPLLVYFFLGRGFPCKVPFFFKSDLSVL